MSLFLMAKIFGGIGLILMLLQVFVFKPKIDKKNKVLLYVTLILIIFVNIIIWIIPLYN